MGFLDRYRQAPPSASGRMRHDMTLGLGGVALTGLWALSGAIRRMSAPPENDRTIALMVADRRVVAHDQDVMALTLVGEHLPRWHPGAHIDIHLPSRLVRQYSLCGDPGSPDTYRITVRRIPDALELSLGHLVAKVDLGRAEKLAAMGAARVVLAMPPTADLDEACDLLSACAARLALTL